MNHKELLFPCPLSARGFGTFLELESSVHTREVQAQKRPQVMYRVARVTTRFTLGLLVQVAQAVLYHREHPTTSRACIPPLVSPTSVEDISETRPMRVQFAAQSFRLLMWHDRNLRTEFDWRLHGQRLDRNKLVCANQVNCAISIVCHTLARERRHRPRHVQRLLKKMHCHEHGGVA